MLRSILGLDIGGANLKAACADGAARSRPFALWQHPEQLGAELAALLRQLPPFDLLAVTMTAELCDCFDTKREGVNRVLDAVEASANGKPVLVWTTEGRFVPVGPAREEPLSVAAANWLALAAFAGRYCPAGPALLIDIGSTTTDIVPLLDGVPVPTGRNDLERLAAGELVYTGVSRTPVCAVLPEVVWRGHTFAPAAELFATTRDAYLLLGDVPEAPDDVNTADGRPATRSYAHARMARMVCADAEVLALDDALAIARQVRQAQEKLLREALAVVSGRLPGLPSCAVLSGSGEFLARRVLAEAAPRTTVLSLNEQIGVEASEAACAYAVAVLASEGSGP